VLSHRMALRPEAVIRGTGMDEVIRSTMGTLRVPGTTDARAGS
jgi:hypothetical protein